jgi:hypothetical protein
VDGSPAGKVKAGEEQAFEDLTDDGDERDRAYIIRILGQRDVFDEQVYKGIVPSSRYSTRGEAGVV